MPEKKFNHLHTHTKQSVLDGMTKIPELVDKAVETGIGGFAVTDHGNLFALPEVLKEQKAAKERGVKIAMGCEFYVTDDRLQKNKESETYHLTVVAQNDEGLTNLKKLSTRSYMEGFYGKPRLDLPLLAEHKNGLIVLSGCLGGQVAQALKNGDKSRAMTLLGDYQDIFKDNYFVEVMPLEIREQIEVNLALTDISKRMGLKTVTTCDCHYLKKEHYAAHDTWLAVQTGAVLSDPDRFRFSTDRAYFQTPEEVLRNSLDSGLDQSSMDRTIEVMERISAYSYDQSLKMPKVDNAPEILKRSAYEGLERKGLLSDPVYRQRLDYELGVINQLGFDSYFLLVQKIVGIAKAKGTPVGPGRGSAAGSLVVWSLGITDIDPIRYGLIFERFLNPARVSPPDIDIDIGPSGRADVIRSIVAEYGPEHVATIATVGTVGGKMGLKDVMRAFGVPFNVANIATKGIQTIDDFVPATETEKEILDIAKILEGIPRNIGTHASGIVVSPLNLYEHWALMNSKIAEELGIGQLQLDMQAVEKEGLVKIDVLGLKELDILKDLAERTGQDPLADIFMFDKKTLEMIYKGDTTGVFQLGTSEGMKRTLKELKCESFEDVSAALALFRPGPLGSGIVDQYIANKTLVKEGKQFPSMNPLTDKLLAETYGVPIYQEQIMEMGKILAGFNMAEADLLRKAMGKKKPEEMAKMKEKWVSGCAKNGIKEEEALTLFEKVEHFSGYGFNKSHSVCYALTSMKMSWYKKHFPAHYWAAKITHEKDLESRGVMAESAKREGITILPPRISTPSEPVKDYSGDCWVVEGKGDPKIILGISTLKGVSEGVAEALTEETKNRGPFINMKDVYDRLVLKVDDKPPILNKRSMVALASVGFFDPVFHDRKAILGWIESKYKNKENIPGFEASSKKTTKTPGTLLFAGFENEASTEKKEHKGVESQPKKAALKTKEHIERDRLNSEVACAGTVLSGTKSAVDTVVRDYFVNKLGRDVCSSQAAIRKSVENNRKNSALVGTLKETRFLISKKTGNPFYMAQIVLPEDAYLVTLFINEASWPTLEKMFKENENKIVAVTGKLSDKKDGFNYMLNVCDIFVPEKKTEKGIGYAIDSAEKKTMNSNFER